MFKTLTVAETNYESDKIVFEHHDFKYNQTLRIELTNKKRLLLTNTNSRIDMLYFTRSDIRSLILALQEAEVYLAEAELVDKLMGR